MLKNLIMPISESRRAELQEKAAILKEVTDTGGTVLTSLVHESGGQMSRLAIIAVFHHTLSLIDGMENLIGSGIVEPVKILLRALLEARMKLFYIMEADTDRGLALIHMHIKNDEAKKRSFKKGTNEFNKLKEALENDREHDFKEEEYIDPDIDAKLAEYVKVLGEPRWVPLNSEYDKLKRPEWYKYFDGPENLKEMAILLNMLGSYELFYRRFSSPTHADDIISDVLINDPAKLTIALFRRNDQLDIIADLAAAYELTIIETIVNRYVQGRQVEIREWSESVSARLKATRVARGALPSEGSG
jgi:hypothetical protein